MKNPKQILVGEIATTSVITVRTRDKLSDVARLFESNDINAAPVVDTDGGCVGIITSHDIVEYESTREEMENQFRHGANFDLAHYGTGIPFSLPGKPFDEVAFHMTSNIGTIDREKSLADAARVMCDQHLHHLVILDSEQRPAGIISTLDVLRAVFADCQPPRHD